MSLYRSELNIIVISLNNNQLNVYTYEAFNNVTKFLMDHLVEMVSFGCCRIVIWLENHFRPPFLFVRLLVVL